MSRKSIKVKVLGPSGKWIAVQGESVGEATRDAIARAQESKQKTSKQKRRKKV